jgi:hypothetical protein
MNGLVRETKRNYQPGVLDTVSISLNNTYGANRVWVEWDDKIVDSGSDLNVDQNRETTGRGSYPFKARWEANKQGAVYLNLEYVPFAVFNDDNWADVSGDVLTERPVWVIRNGLADDPQDASSWAADNGVKYSDVAGNGGIAIGVVDPAHPFTSGLFEDNNPWPADGTETVDKALIALDTGLGFLPGVGYGKYAIKQVVTATTTLSLPSMKLPKDGGDYDHKLNVDDTANNGLTFNKLGNLQHPLSIAITSDGP